MYYRPRLFIETTVDGLDGGGSGGGGGGGGGMALDLRGNTVDNFTMGTRSNFRVTAKYFARVGFYPWRFIPAASFGQMGFPLAGVEGGRGWGVFRGSGDISGDKYSGVSVVPCTAPCAALPPGSRDTK